MRTTLCRSLFCFGLLLLLGSISAFAASPAPGACDPGAILVAALGQQSSQATFAPTRPAAAPLFEVEMPGLESSVTFHGYCRCSCSRIKNCNTSADCGGGACLGGITCC